MSVKRTVKKVTAVTLALAMAFGVSPVVNAGAKSKVKKPTISPKTVVIVKGESKTLKVKKGTYKIKSVKWSSKNKKVATVNKKGKVTAKDYGIAKIQAVVTTKKSAKKTKKYTLTRKVEVIEDEEPNEPDVVPDTWLIPSSAAIEEGVATKFEAINKELAGANYTPFALVGIYFGSDNVNKWRVLSKKTYITAELKSSYVIAEISEEGDTVHLDKIVETGLDVLPASGLEGGWSECADPVLSLDDLDIIQSYLNPEVLLGGQSYVPIAKIGEQVVAGVKYKLLVERHTAGIAKPVPTYVIIDVFVGNDGTYEVDLANAIAIGMEDKTEGLRASGVQLKGEYEGVTIKEVGLDLVGGTTWNAYAIFSNATDKDIEFDTSKFTYELPDGKTYKLIPSFWSLRKNHSYIQWATTALSKDFIAALHVGDKVKVSYDGLEIGWISSVQWP